MYKRQTLTRSIYTSLTTFISIAVLYVLGVSSIKEFALPLMIGIVVGCYSSIFVCSPLYFDLNGGGKSSKYLAQVKKQTRQNKKKS